MDAASESEYGSEQTHNRSNDSAVSAPAAVVDWVPPESPGNSFAGPDVPGQEYRWHLARARSSAAPEQVTGDGRERSPTRGASSRPAGSTAQGSIALSALPPANTLDLTTSSSDSEGESHTMTHSSATSQSDSEGESLDVGSESGSLSRTDSGTLSDSVSLSESESDGGRDGDADGDGDDGGCSADDDRTDDEARRRRTCDQGRYVPSLGDSRDVPSMTLAITSVISFVSRCREVKWRRRR